MNKDQGLLCPYLILLSSRPFFIGVETIFILWLLNGTFWGPSCLQTQGEVASLPSSFLCCRSQSSNLRSDGMSLEMRRKTPGSAYALPSPSQGPPDKFSHSLGCSPYRKGVPGRPAILGGPFWLILHFSVVFHFQYFLKEPVLCCAPLHTALCAVMTSKHPHCISTV